MKVRRNPCGHGSRIAVVDPDDAVRDSLVFSLQVEGYAVDAFANATCFLESETQDHDCLVAASRLPDLPGTLLIERHLQMYPGCAAVLMADRPGAAVEGPHVATMLKPLDGAALTQAVAQALRFNRKDCDLNRKD